VTVATALRRAGVQIVFEGTARVTWRRSGPARWTPTGLWPTSCQAANLLDQVNGGAPLLVVLEQVVATVPMLAEEFADAPPAIAALAEDTGGAVVDVRIPTLDWLPAELRDRGLRFAHASTATAAGTPDLLVPPLALEAPATAMPNVRFAHVLDPRRYRRSEVPAVARHAFATRQIPAACPADVLV
jgi:hypothetical protein